MARKKRRRSSGRAIVLVASFLYLQVYKFHIPEAHRAVKVESASGWALLTSGIGLSDWWKNKMFFESFINKLSSSGYPDW